MNNSTRGEGLSSLLSQVLIEVKKGSFNNAKEIFERISSEYSQYEDIFSFSAKYCEAKVKGAYLNKSAINLLSKKETKSELVPRKSLNVTPLGKRLPITVLVLTWDVGHNPLGRSYMLAEALKPHVTNLVLAGFQFPRYGSEIWEPLKNSALPVISLKGENLPELLDTFDKVVKRFQPDIVIACKPRLPSLQLAAMFKKQYGIPLIVDIDDHELSFIKNKLPLAVEDLHHALGTSASIEPYEEVWTRVSNDLINIADERIVSNIALEEEFGGLQIAHVRDETKFDPKLYNKVEARLKYGIPSDAKVVMFFGTPRIHKGIGTIARAVANINDDRFLFVVVGTAPDKRVTSQLHELSAGRILNLPNQPFDSIPEIINMADVVCLPQDVTHETSKYQLPAKAIDAVAMGIPLLVSKTKPLLQLVDKGVATLIDENNLAEQLSKLASLTLEDVSLAKNREIFLNEYSYSSAAEKLKLIISQVLRRKDAFSAAKLDRLRCVQEQIFQYDNVTTCDTSNGKKDIVIFWKQNDSAIYGRRHDMVAKMLSERPDVRKVLLIDAPISTFDLNNKVHLNKQLTQGRTVYIKTYEKKLGKLDTEKLVYDVFVYKAGAYYVDIPVSGRKPLINDYRKFLNSIFDREGIKSAECTFWFYPKNYLAEELIDYFEPKSVVVDVVDDHRAWPNVSEGEIAKLTEHYSSLLKKAHLAFANCQSVYDSMSKYTNCLKLVPNGCDKNPEVIEYSAGFMTDIRVHDGPVIGFVGNLESKIDDKLIENLAAEMPEALIVLVGSTHANPDINRLSDIPNVIMPGVVENLYVNAVIKEFDVCIVPHKRMALTKNMNPLKVFVYLSNKRPVVTTDVDNLPCCDAVLVSKNENEFIQNVKDAIANKFDEAVYSKFIEENSWECRFKLLDQYFEGGVNT